MGARKAGAENMHADRDQIAAIERHAAAHNARVTILPAELDVSGGLPLERRPSLLAAIEGVERGEYHAIVVAYLSRLGRNVREQLRAWDRVEAAGGRIIIVQEGIDTSTPTGRLQRTIMLGIAEHEREQHAERFERLREWATMAGVWQRRQTPLGYSRDPETRRLALNGDADLVRCAFADRAAGRPVVAIARDLGMTPSGVRGLLRNRVYLGELRVGEHINPSAHPALVTDDVWHAAQAVRVTRPARTTAHPALLAGLVRCAGCSHVMSRARQARVVYACHVHHSAGRCPAPAAITARLLDEHVERIALARLAALWMRADRDVTPVAEARADLAAAESELAAFLAGVQAAGLAPEQFAAAVRERAAAVDAARDRLAVLLAARPLDAIDGDPVEAWSRMNDAQRNHLLGRLVEAVVVTRVGRGGRVVPVAERVRAIRHGAGLIDTARYRGLARPIIGVALPDPGSPDVLGVHLAHDDL